MYTVYTQAKSRSTYSTVNELTVLSGLETRKHYVCNISPQNYMRKFTVILKASADGMQVCLATAVQPFLLAWPAGLFSLPAQD